MTELVVITGPIASGKSSVAHRLAAQLLAAGRSAACLDLDDVVWSLSAPPEQFDASWPRARAVHSALVGAWLRSGIDVVIAHGPFFTAEETSVLLSDVGDHRPRRALLLAPFDVALERVEGESDRQASGDPVFLRRTYDRFNALRDEMPVCEWTFDTTTLTADECATVISEALLRHSAPATPD